MEEKREKENLRKRRTSQRTNRERGEKKVKHYEKESLRKQMKKERGKNGRKIQMESVRKKSKVN